MDDRSLGAQGTRHVCARHTLSPRHIAQWLYLMLPVCAASMAAPFAPDIKVPLRDELAVEVPKALDLPETVAATYGVLLNDALATHDLALLNNQFVLLVDRSPAVQAALLMWGSTPSGWSLVGAVPVSTGLPGRFEHFLSPLGVFEHSLANPDFRAEGTRNALGIRGYGLRGARVYDFGWVASPKGWGDHAWSTMRLQVHATDPDILEPRLGTAQSKGCIRIPAAFNEFLDRNGVLDADYDEALDAGRHLWVLRPDRRRSEWAGRWLVVIDSGAVERPRWAAPRR